MHVAVVRVGRALVNVGKVAGAKRSAPFAAGPKVAHSPATIRIHGPASRLVTGFVEGRLNSGSPDFVIVAFTRTRHQLCFSLLRQGRGQPTGRKHLTRLNVVLRLKHADPQACIAR
jgi:hypothetical protein